MGIKKEDTVLLEFVCPKCKNMYFFIGFKAKKKRRKR